MHRRILLLVLAFTVCSSTPAWAWNAKGHMVVARLAWKELTPQERAKVLQFLATHPHHDEFLKVNRPNNIPEDEWIFMRAATWADWVKGGPPARRKYDNRPAHYINIPFVQLGSTVTPPPLPAIKRRPIPEGIAKAS